jgi:hypothetical protein
MDYETTGLDYYSPDFAITSAAFKWQGGHRDKETQYTEDLSYIRYLIEQSIKDGYSFVVHNLQFEYGCTLYQFPDLVHQMQWIDTMRLVQVYDNGGKKAQGMQNQSGMMTIEDELAILEGTIRTPSTGLGLTAAASRLLPPSLQDMKKEAHDYLEKEHGIKKEHGSHLQLLPPEIMERYNVGDVLVTEALFNTCIQEFKRIRYDWTQDHKLYTHIAKRISKAKGVGIPVNRAKLARQINRLQRKITLTERAFKIELWDEIKQFETKRLQKWVTGCGTERGNKARAEKTVPGSIYWEKEVRFNPNSSAQKRTLFCDILGIIPKFYTDKSTPEKPSPSFKAAHMPHYGKGGKILANKKKIQLVLKQMENLLALSAKDGRWHHDLRACGTATGRMKGGRHD